MKLKIVLALVLFAPQTWSAVDHRSSWQKPSSLPVTRQVSGQELYSAVIFNAGLAAAEIGNRLGFPAEKIGPAYLSENQKAVLSRIEQLNPGFFEDFQNQMTSDNPVLVRQALDSGIAIGRQALRELGQGQKSQYSPIAKNFTSAATVAVAIVIVGVVVSTSTFTSTFSLLENDGYEKSSLVRDQVVIDLTAALASET